MTHLTNQSFKAGVFAEVPQGGGYPFPCLCNRQPVAILGRKLHRSHERERCDTLFGHIEYRHGKSVGTHNGFAEHQRVSVLADESHNFFELRPIGNRGGRDLLAGLSFDRLGNVGTKGHSDTTLRGGMKGEFGAYPQGNLHDGRSMDGFDDNYARLGETSEVDGQGCLVPQLRHDRARDGEQVDSVMGRSTQDVQLHAEPVTRRRGILDQKTSLNQGAGMTEYRSFGESQRRGNFADADFLLSLGDDVQNVECDMDGSDTAVRVIDLVAQCCLPIIFFIVIANAVRQSLTKSLYLFINSMEMHYAKF